jgi:hypothetical protein
MIHIKITNSNVVGLENLSRVLSVTKYTEDFLGKTFTVPYTIKHVNINDESVGIPDVYGELIASNETILDINKTTFQPEIESENTMKMGRYDYFKQLQKQISNETIISAQINTLNLKNYFQ